MRILTKAAILGLVVMVAGIVTYAQGRPQCFDLNRPGACFWDDGGGFYRMWGWDDDGDWVLVEIFGDDFLQVRPDGTWFGLATQQNVPLYVCPATAGGFDCLYDYFFNGIRRPGMLIGTAHINSVGVWDMSVSPLDFSCPYTHHVQGDVFDEDGSAYTGTWIQMKVPEAGSDECRVLKNEVKVTAQ